MSQSLNGRGLIEFTASAANRTLTANENGTGFRNTGATGAVVFTLPPATVGLHYYFYVDAAQELRIDPAALETISLPSNGVPGAGGKYLTADAVGESVHLVCAKAGTWAAFGSHGTWTAEA